MIEWTDNSHRDRIEIPVADGRCSIETGDKRTRNNSEMAHCHFRFDNAGRRVFDALIYCLIYAVSECER